MVKSGVRQAGENVPDGNLSGKFKRVIARSDVELEECSKEMA